MGTCIGVNPSPTPSGAEAPRSDAAEGRLRLLRLLHLLPLRLLLRLLLLRPRLLRLLLLRLRLLQNAAKRLQFPAERSKTIPN